MNKEANAIINAFQLGQNDRRLKKPYNNPFKKASEKGKYKAYKNGYGM